MTSTLSPVEQWTNEHLFLIASQRDWDKVPPLSLKKKMVQIKLVKENNYYFVEKRSTGNLANLNKREIICFQKVKYTGMDNIDLLRSSEHKSQSMLIDSSSLDVTKPIFESVVRTKWCGLDTDNWAELIQPYPKTNKNGKNQPQYFFTQDAAVILAWVRGVLRSTQNFHADGFVHCDLLSRNIVISCKPVAGNPYQFELDLDSPNIIDLEFCLTPTTSDPNKWGDSSLREGFFDVNRDPIPLNPEERSEYLCYGPIYKGASDALDTMMPYRYRYLYKVEGKDPYVYKSKTEDENGNKKDWRDYYFDKNGRRIKHPQPFDKFKEIDWGVDLFSLGVSVREMIRENRYLKGDEKVLDYLYDLPNILRGYEALCKDQNPRPTPHAELIKKIDELIGKNTYKKYIVTVPKEVYKDFAPVEEKTEPKPKSETLRSSLPPPPPSKSTPWNTKRLTTGAIMLLGIAGGGVWWAGQEGKMPVPAPAPAPPASPAPVSIANPAVCIYCPEMVAIPAGSFSMGDNEFNSTKPIHTVNIKRFEIGRYEVTQGQWKAVMGSNPSNFNSCGDKCPVEQVSWDDIQVYLQKLNQKTGSNYRLPSEAEWEYACRGGKQQKYCGSDDVGDVAWYWDNGDKKTHPVGQKQGNGFGLYDMSGNVWEWVEDYWHGDYNGAPSDGSAWLSGNSKVQRVLRGGSWIYFTDFSRAAYRGNGSPGYHDCNCGFRVARTVP